MSNFLTFSKLVRKQFDMMSKGELFTTDIDTDVLWNAYLGAFPQGTDPIFKERTEHDCNCCKQFIANIANAVSIKDGVMTTVWDAAIVDAPHPYDVVSATMAEIVRSSNVKNIFRKSEARYGQEVSYQQIENNDVKQWHHFEAELKCKFVSAEGPTLMSVAKSNVHVFQRGLDELSMSAIDSVLDLIKSNSIYRGQEFQSIMEQFKHFKEQYGKLNSDQSKNSYVWEHFSNFASRLRNTVIGSLVQDLTEGVDLEQAVRMYESKVAPDTYKRTTSLITPNMIKEAMKTVDDLGIGESLKRRFANLSDISVNDVLFVDTKARDQMKDGGIADLLMKEVKPQKKATQHKIEIGISEFINTVIPRSESMELLLKNELSENLMSLTAPINEDAQNIFKWDNNLSWSYNGNVADSIKEKVKRAGGNVDAQMRVSLNWFNTDDLDIYVTEPNGNRIYFSNKSNKLDVDMNVSNPVCDAVENVRWLTTPSDGCYSVMVNNFTKRESIDVGFNLEVESHGKIYEFSYPKGVQGNVKSIEIYVKNGEIVSIDKHSGIQENSACREIWNLKTETFVKVNTIATSPNYMDENGSGNKHWFFVLDDCINPDETRGFYNEQLRTDLTKHRKVFEILADKLKCEYTTKQMSGVGFSSTKKNSVVVHAKGEKLNQLYKINF
jgi:hypothetical protein